MKKYFFFHKVAHRKDLDNLQKNRFIATEYFKQYEQSDQSTDRWLEEAYKTLYAKYKHKYPNDEEVLENGVEKLLDITLHDIETQSSIKNSIENKVGFTIALLTLLISILFENNIISILWSKCNFTTQETGLLPIILHYIYGFLHLFILLLLLFTGLRTILLIKACLFSKSYKSLNLYHDLQKDCLFAIDNKELFLLHYLIKTTRIWYYNEQINEGKSKSFDKLIQTSLYFFIVVIIAYTTTLF